MNTRSIHVFMLCSAIVAGGVSGITNGEMDFFNQQKLTSHLIVNLFLLNVDQGKLEIFGHTINRSQLQSRQVAYIHNLDDDSLSVSIHMHLKEAIIIPYVKDFYIDAISVEVDKDGNIKEIKSHVTPDQ